MEDKQCAHCGGNMTYKEGISKAGKPYKMFKCSQCQEVEWVPDGKSAPRWDKKPGQWKDPVANRTIDNKTVDNEERIIMGLTLILEELKKLNAKK